MNDREQTGSRPRIAAIATIYHKYSHAQHIVDRFLEGYGWEGRHHRPEMDLVSLFVDQVGDNDLSRERAARFTGMRVYPTISDALTLGGNSLDVDGILIIAEHGDYPVNARGQTLYPRYEFFQEVVRVFRESGRSAPVFNDKHLSWNWERAKSMYDVSLELDFAFMAGSSLPVTWRTPSLEMPLGAEVREAICVAYGGVDSYDFHAIEVVQCMVERRRGGEAGIRRIRTYKGEDFWRAHHERVWSRELFDAALCRSHTLVPARAGFNHVFPTIDEMKALVKEPIGYHFEYLDGLTGAVLLMNGLVSDFTFAARIEGQEEPLSTQMYLPMPPAYTTLASFFSPQVNNIERMFLSGRPSYPVERTLLTTGMVAAAIDSIETGGSSVETPHLAIAYSPNPQSTYWRT